MNNKWLDSVLDDFILKNRLHGILSDKQKETFTRNMIKKVTNFYGRETTSYSYQKGDFTFKVLGNKYSLTNEKEWEVIKLKDKLNRQKESLKIAIALNKANRITKHKLNIIGLQYRLKNL